MAKSADAFRTISEVAEWLELPSHVLRFWESKFTQIKPVKRAGGRRYYRPADMLLLGGIKQLLHDDGMTIKGAQKVLRDKGVKEVAKLSQPLDGDSALDDTDTILGIDQTPKTVPDAPFIEAEAPDAAADVISFAHRTPAPEQEPELAFELEDDTPAPATAAPSQDTPTTPEDEPVSTKPSELPAFLRPSGEASAPVSFTVDVPDDPSDSELDVPAGILSNLAALTTEIPPEMRQGLIAAQSALRALSA
ncbi:MerR family transcriptional regulator [Lentibacter sp.]|uniref:MerR family transcriptional regulator n=1 Tax=Lentibacter sp. TaxID=2024994 RepID=UPI003F6BB48A